MIQSQELTTGIIEDLVWIRTENSISEKLWDKINNITHDYSFIETRDDVWMIVRSFVWDSIQDSILNPVFFSVEDSINKLNGN